MGIKTRYFVGFFIIILFAAAIYILQFGVKSVKNNPIQNVPSTTLQQELDNHSVIGALVQNILLERENDSLKQVNEKINFLLNFSQAKQGELYHLLLKANRKIKKLQKEVDDIKASPSTSQIMDETDKAMLMEKFWKVFGPTFFEIAKEQSHTTKSILPLSFFNAPLERPSEQDTSRDN